MTIAHKFEDYVFNRVVSKDVSLYPIPTKDMALIPGPAGLPGAQHNYPDNQVGSSIFDIGIEFPFNGSVYKHIVVTVSGAIVLIDPQEDLSSLDSNDILNKCFSGPSIIAHFPVRYVVLAPWLSVGGYAGYSGTNYNGVKNFADDLSNLPDYQSVSDVSFGVMPTVQRVGIGGYSIYENGIRYKNISDSINGNGIIIRWNSIINVDTTGDFDKNVIPARYEAILYESGLIEFRYDKLQPFFNTSNKLLCQSGIYVNDLPEVDENDVPINELNLRDFSTKNYDEKQYKFGGLVYDNDYDNVKHCSLSTKTDWPATTEYCALNSFSPPKVLRKILPKLELNKFDNAICLPTNTTYQTSFNDLNTLVFSEQDNIDFPVTLPQRYSESTTLFNQNIDVHGYGDNGFTITSSITPSGTDNFTKSLPKTKIKPFNDEHVEQGKINEPYYEYGTGLNDIGQGLNQSLYSKSKIELEFPVNFPTAMFNFTSSLYYYNTKEKQWLLPDQSVNTIYSVYPSSSLDEYISSPNLINPLFAINNNSSPNDAVGFGAFGNLVASGSTIKLRDTSPGVYAIEDDIGENSINNQLGYSYNHSDSTKILSTYFSNSFQNSVNYLAREDKGEQFQLPITKPFLIEKVVFELPVSISSDWFNDKTRTPIQIGSMTDDLGGDAYAYDDDAFVRFNGIKSTSLDVAGPAITISLFNQQISIQPNPSRAGTYLYQYRDLITSGTIIPSGDNVKNVDVRYADSNGPNFSGTTPTVIINPIGFKSFDLTPACVITPNLETGEFVGRILVETVAGVSHGTVIGLKSLLLNNGVWLNTLKASKFVKDYVASKTIKINDDSTIYSGVNNAWLELLEAGSSPSPVQTNIIKDVSVFGRAASSFLPSGRSLYGREHITTQNVLNNGEFANPLYRIIDNPEDIASLTLINSACDYLDTQSESATIITSAINVSKTVASPYLVYPGDKLTLAISKMRPAISTFGSKNKVDSNPDYFGGNSHSVVLDSGIIKMTIYGSELQDNKEHHDTLKQTLGTKCVHETIGENSFSDEFEVEYREQFLGSYTDNYITGSLLRIDPKTKTIATNSIDSANDLSRGNVFSKVFARDQLPPASSPFTSYEARTNRSKNFRLQPWWERVGEQRTVNHMSDGERYYDSMVPNLNKCFQVDGCDVWKNNSSLPHESPLWVIPIYSNADYAGFMYFNSDKNIINSEYVNNDWVQSFPFESRYSEVNRESSLEQAIISNKRFEGLANAPTVVSASNITNFFPYFTFPYDRFTYVDADVGRSYVSFHAVTQSLNQTELTKVMYGYGDCNMRNYPSMMSEDPPIGNTHMPSYHEEDYFSDMPGITGRINGTKYAFGPIIRGWKYGLINGLATNTKAVFRRGKFGQLRDMLEQRLFTKFFEANNQQTLTSPVIIRFVDSAGNLTRPENTWSQNLSFEATSSLPYFDGEARNRNPINTNTLNSHIVSFNNVDLFNNVTL